MFTTNYTLPRYVSSKCFLLNFVHDLLLFSDPKQKCTETMIVLQKMEMSEASQEDCEIMKAVCTSVSTRAAHLVSAGNYK